MSCIGKFKRNLINFQETDPFLASQPSPQNPFQYASKQTKFFLWNSKGIFPNECFILIHLAVKVPDTKTKPVLHAKPHFRTKKAEKTSFGEGHEAQFWSQKGCSKAKESRKLPPLNRTRRWKREILKVVQESKMNWVN